MGKQNIRAEIDKLRKKLYTPEVGLTIDDYSKLKWLLVESKKDKSSSGIKYFEAVKEMLDALVASGMIYGFSKNNYDYVTKELPLLPLVFANKSTNKPVSHQGKKKKELPIYEYLNGEQFKFNYQIENGVMVLTLKGHLIKIVSIYDNNDKPYVRGINNIKYLTEVDNISETAAIEVLLGIYNCDYEVKDELKDIVEFYKDALCSDEFCDFLEVGRRKAQERGLDTSFYDKMDEFIDRAFNDEYDPNFVLEDVPNRLVFERK